MIIKIKACQAKIYAMNKAYRKRKKKKTNKYISNFIMKIKSYNIMTKNQKI